MPKLKALSVKQEKFVDAYLGEAAGNGTKAAQLAGYRGSPQTLKSVASENLTKPDIAKEVKKRLKTVMTSEEVLGELSEIASAECCEPVRVGEKIKALELMGKHHKLLTDRIETVETLNYADVERLGQQLISTLIEAAQRLRARQAALPAAVDQ